MSSTLHKIKDKLSGGSSEDTTTTGTTSQGSSTRTAHEEAPVVKERHHDQVEHVDKTRRDEIHEQDKVNTVIQPIKDEQQKGLSRHEVNEGTEVHEHGHAGLDRNAEAELRKRREDIARQGGTEHSESHTNVDEKGDTHVHNREHTVTQVQPVVEKDVYHPHRVEHNKKEVEVVHEPTKVGSTEVAPTVTVDEYNRQH